jgi:hypothetical protein
MRCGAGWRLILYYYSEKITASAEIGQFFYLFIVKNAKL